MNIIETKKLKLKIFISYSHLDEEFIKSFTKHLTVLKDKNLIEEWLDRKMFAGDELDKKIQDNLNNSDIVLWFISKNYLSSSACKKEKEESIELQSKLNVKIIPIILTSCLWQEDSDISKRLAIPKDGQCVEKPDNDVAWTYIVKEIQKIASKEIELRKIKISENFKSFLKDASDLTYGHSEKEKVVIEDIFIYPDLVMYDNNAEEKAKKFSSSKLVDFVLKNKKIIIAGGMLSGKTTLCKSLFVNFFNRNFIPVYISYNDRENNLFINKLIEIKLQEQYGNDNLLNFKDIVIPIIDDFYCIQGFKEKEKILEYLKDFKYTVLILDKIFGINLKNASLIENYINFEIKELSPSLRNELIEKWINLTDIKKGFLQENHKYKKLDEFTDLVNYTLGKVFSSGIMDAYPFYILSILSSYNTLSKPLDQEITSQGYCYQALIYAFLRKQKVDNAEIDSYINFLTEISYFFFKEQKEVITKDDFGRFKKNYQKQYNLLVKEEKLLKDLSATNILSINSFGQYSFNSKYIYYYFIAKYLSEHVEELKIKEEINNILTNLHKDENSYISIFILHHIKNYDILDTIEIQLMYLFDKYKPAELSKKEMLFFDKEIDNIFHVNLLPKMKSNPEEERKKILEKKDKLEEQEKTKENLDFGDSNGLEKDLRKSVRIVQVIGQIMRNRAGSLKKAKLLELFKTSMELHLRILTSFFELIKSTENQKDIVNYLRNKLSLSLKEKNRNLKEEELEKMATNLFWNMNFKVVYGIIKLLICSIGSDKLKDVTCFVCDEINTPASFLIKHGIYMQYLKELDTKAITDAIGDNKFFSETSIRNLKQLVIEYCSLNDISFQERRKIEDKLNFRPNVLLKFRTEYKDKNK